MTEYKAEFRVVGAQVRALTWAVRLIASIIVLTVGGARGVGGEGGAGVSREQGWGNLCGARPGEFNRSLQDLFEDLGNLVGVDPIRQLCRQAACPPITLRFCSYAARRRIGPTTRDGILREALHARRRPWLM